MEQGLEAEKSERPDELLLGRGQGQAAQAPARLELGAEPAQEVALLLALGILHLLEVPVQALEAGVGLDEIGQDEFLLHAPGVGRGVDPAPGRRQVGVRERPDDVDEAVRPPQMVEEEAGLDLAERYAGQVGQVHRGGHPALVGVGGRQGVQPGVGQRDGPDVGLAPAVVVGRDRGVGAGQEIEERRLAGLGVTEQGDVHGTSKAGLAGGVKARTSRLRRPRRIAGRKRTEFRDMTLFS